MKASLRRGLSNVYAAPVTADDDTTYTAGTPFHLIPAGEMTRTVDAERTNVYFDNVVFETIAREGNTDITINGASISESDIAAITGKYIDSTTGAIIDTGDSEVKYFALGGDADASNGGGEKFWFLKGYFDIPELADKTRDDTSDYNGLTLVFHAVATTHKFTVGTKTATCKRVVMDKTVSKVKSTKNWTEQVVTPDVLGTIIELIETPVPDPNPNPNPNPEGT